MEELIPKLIIARACWSWEVMTRYNTFCCIQTLALIRSERRRSKVMVTQDKRCWLVVTAVKRIRRRAVQNYMHSITKCLTNSLVEHVGAFVDPTKIGRSRYRRNEKSILIKKKLKNCRSLCLIHRILNIFSNLVVRSTICCV